MPRIYLALLSMLSITAQAIDVSHTASPPLIDGLNQDKQWQQAKWLPLNQVIIGGQLDPADFTGQYRLLWDSQAIYLQAKITDNILYDNNPNPVEGYWSDDCLEVFIDEDASGGDHQYNFNAFAYHVSLDNQVVDLSTDKTAKLYNSHVTSRWQRQSNPPYDMIWELAIRVYDDSFKDDKDAVPVTLHKDKKLGFMLAYCDNDGSEFREHFINSKDIVPLAGDKNRGWIDASVFDTITLRE
ncbi:sugar-binding protein [Aliiglaciecola litoralis]|uniref:Carbohydrate-binding domain-containing protein n=1 Tax=Aliiglaciecola litoralis TaxID=582857 RepID=A0ABP3WY91_9ALTE